LDLYRSGDFEYLNLDPALSFNSEVDLLEQELSNLKSPLAAQNFESENCVAMLKSLPNLTPYQAADERLWAMLSHTVLLPHARARWPRRRAGCRAEAPRRASPRRNGQAA
jgi:hypothetical protein